MVLKNHFKNAPLIFIANWNICEIATINSLEQTGCTDKYVFVFKRIPARRNFFSVKDRSPNVLTLYAKILLIYSSVVSKILGGMNR